MTRQSNSAGFIKIILTIIIAVVILAVLKIDLKEILASETTQHNLEVLKEIGEKIWTFFLYLWENYVKEPALWVWQNLVLDIIWPTVTEWLAKLKQ